MNEMIEIHDSTLSGATWDGRDLALHFAPAYLHRSAGEPGVDPGTGWIQDLDLIVSEARLAEFPATLPAWLFDGEFAEGDRLWSNTIPVEPSQRGNVALVAITEHSEWLRVSGTGAAIVRRGEARYMEDYLGTA